MRRREFITLLGGAAVWPLAARAQRTAMPMVAFVNSASPDGYSPMVAAFRQGLKEGGYVEGQNVTVEYRWAEGHYDRASAIAPELIDRKAAVIVANTPGVLAMKAVITTTPIVFTTASDPVQAGLVASMSRPSANVTGATALAVELAAKRLELAHQLMPTASVIAALINPTNRNTAEPQMRDLRAAAQALGLELHVMQASTEGEFDAVFTNLAERRPGALVIGTDGFFISRSEQLAAMTVRHGVPAIFENREFVAAGGLMSYGGSLPDAYRLAGVYVARILKGEKPGELPVQQSTKVQMFLNLKTAKALGITVPPPLIARADEVIE